MKTLFPHAFSAATIVVVYTLGEQSPNPTIIERGPEWIP